MNSDIVYLAGMMDGDGSISIARRQYNERRSRHILTVAVTNCSRELMEWLEERWGGVIHPKPPTRNGRPIFQWAITSQKAGELLEDIVEHLIVKRDQANIALDFRATFGKIAYRQGGVSQEITDLRDAMSEAVSRLNRGLELG